jgi:hypothetical protein
MKLAFVVFAVVVAIAAGCGGGGSASGSSAPHTNNGYPQDVRDQFLKSCAAQAKSASNLSDDRINSYCGCTLDYIEHRVDFAEFKQADRAVSTLNRAPRHARAVFLAAIKHCERNS